MQVATRLALAASVALFSLAVSDDAVARHRPIACADLITHYRARDVVITSATEVPEVTTGQNAAPAHCDVRGTISDNIRFALFLPVQWNRRFQMVGNGGKAGSISIGDMRTALRLGYAASSTDTGQSDDYFSVRDETIKDIRSVLTVVGGRIVHAEAEFATLNQPKRPPKDKKHGDDDDDDDD